jgi:predicted Zn-dependent peptidase
VESSRLPGAIAISTYTKTETTVEAIDRALAILKRLTDKGLTDEQLRAAKAYVKGQFPTGRLETADQVAAVAGELELLNLSRDEIDGYFQRIDAVTLAQANAAARKYYRSDDLLFVLVGTAGKVENLVKKYAPTVKVVRATAPGWGQ